ncbi:PAS domain-containing protein [Spirosoma rhododendri]|uniref:PAS domain-containing protein n=1 Tax=Spirosoma rhododendri TaxID=2728024 RepID=A0A7L5DGR6_9BACT|nr:PAS domain-containing protein [Spirosoma rhododendri]QJD77145.1 PAS domain-containing protein [Spirosoma rhododendri]
MIPADTNSTTEQQTQRPRPEGNRPYPALSYEIFLLMHAQDRARRSEETLFQRLGNIFDWQLSRRQQQQYAQKLKTGFTLVLTDAARSIIWTSNSFLSMTGYSNSEVVGKTPKMLHGPATNPAVVQQIRESLHRRKPVKAELLNYRKNGDTYMCQIEINPLYDGQGELTHFLAVEKEIA